MPRAYMLSGMALAGLTLLPISAYAAPPATLTQALVAAYYNNPTLQQQRAALRQADEGVPTALSGWRPTVTFQGDAGRVTGSEKYRSSAYDPTTQKYVTTSSKVPENGTETSAQVTVTQPIYSGGKVVAQTRQAKNAVYAARAQLLATEQTTFQNVVQAYVTVVQDQKLLALQHSNQQVLTRQLHDTQTQFNIGEITMTSVAQAQASLAQAKQQVAVAEGNLKMARENFRQLVGEDPADNLAPPQPLVLPVDSAVKAGALAVRNNPNVVAAKFTDASDKDAVDVAFAALMPQLTFQASAYDLSGSSGQNNYTSGASFIGQLTVPLYQGGKEYSAIRQAKAKQQQDFAAILAAQRKAYSDATQAWQGLDAARTSILASNAQIKADAVALDGTEREELVGTRTTLDVLNAQEALLTAQIQQVQSIGQLVTYSYNIAVAIGRLTAKDLDLPVHDYNDQKYYDAVKYAGIGTGGGADAAAGIAPDGEMLNAPPVSPIVPVSSAAPATP
ncbi:TolC family outer membrane protein [Acidocella aminolytica]|uniref:Secretion system type I outer membrane protein TolC n=1 Tax=Acidocella aminolytica 101 = DSM 11237 TaxID=1120923 RepID=A0A0D6PHI0_9PROT|nr:TolC family outer membrane protein [Acidocella aminolytica]GAN80658.1 secretion system type I outer membrane protein TolC [Acidocella aminolytica 101 = DSM 11237]SHE54897.1 outer membrane protein [Acidocella aminolytica 101 = DSM 11237]